MDLLADERPSIAVEFRGEVILWKGPAPYLFVPVPEAESAEISAVSSLVTYGWGVIPVSVRIGESTWATSLFPRHGRYLVPIKAAIQTAESLEVGDAVTASLSITLPDWIPLEL